MFKRDFKLPAKFTVLNVYQDINFPHDFYSNKRIRLDGEIF